MDGGSHFYNTYETADGKWVSVGSIELQFYSLLLEKSGLGDSGGLPEQMSREGRHQENLQSIFLTKTRDEWDEIMLGTDVLRARTKLRRSQAHPHNTERQTLSSRMVFIRLHPRLDSVEQRLNCQRVAEPQAQNLNQFWLKRDLLQRK